MFRSTQGDDMTTCVSEDAATAGAPTLHSAAPFPCSPTPEEKMYLLAFATIVAAIICIPFSLHHIRATMSALSRRLLMMGSREKLIFAPKDDQYLRSSLDRAGLHDDPLQQFHLWFTQAQEHPVHQPEGTILSTANLPSGRISARTVYLKELDPRGFVVYSNWGTSRKSKDIANNPNAALTFWWREQERQVRVEGVTERLKPEESQVYYDTRIRGSRIGAWASRQSSVLPDRALLEQQVKAVEERFEGEEKIPVPPFWGGLRIIPTYIEFWQGRASRLHDRFIYTRDSPTDTNWKIERLSP